MRSRSRGFGRPLVLLSVLVAIAGCASAPEKGGMMRTLEGQVIYRERMLLPPGAEIEVRLEEMVATDAPATLVASRRYPAQGGPPYPFTLHYDPEQLDPHSDYALRARIEAEGRLMFSNQTPVPADGGEHLEVLVERVSVASNLAGAVETSLTDTYWKLIEIEGAPAGLGAGDREPFMVLGGLDSRVSGFGGCNQFMGGYAQSQSELIFSRLASTMMACIDGMDLEQRFLGALEQVSRYLIDGEQLMLYGEEGDQPLLRFAAGAMK